MMPIKTYKKIETIVLYFVIKKNLELSFQNGPEHETTFLSILFLKKNVLIFSLWRLWPYQTWNVESWEKWLIMKDDATISSDKVAISKLALSNARETNSPTLWYRNRTLLVRARWHSLTKLDQDLTAPPPPPVWSTSNQQPLTRNTNACTHTRKVILFLGQSMLW